MCKGKSNNDIDSCKSQMDSHIGSIEDILSCMSSLDPK